MSLRNSQARWLILSLIVLVLDLTSKLIANTYLSYATPVKVLPFFNLTLLYNYGAAFSFLSNQNTTWQLILFSAIAIVISIFIIIWLLRQSKTTPNTPAIALALILGGALGNVIDRIYHGFVVDFLDFHLKGYHWPSFNIADSAICIGAALFILSSFFSKTSK